MLKDLVLSNRSYRRFYQDEEISVETLKELVELARNTASTVNSQALKYKLVCKSEENAKVFDTLAWAGLLKGKGTPCEGERPSAYIIILCDLEIGQNKFWDEGIAAQTILLGAAEKGLGGCMLGSIKREELAKDLSIDTEKYSIDLVLALGKPKETVKLVEMNETKSTAYYRDENGIHYVPKRSLEDIII